MLLQCICGLLPAGYAAAKLPRVAALLDIAVASPVCNGVTRRCYKTATIMVEPNESEKITGLARESCSMEPFA